MPTYSAESLQVLKSLSEVVDLRLPTYELTKALVAEEGSIVDAVNKIIKSGVCIRFVSVQELQGLIAQGRLVSAAEASAMRLWNYERIWV